MTEESFTEEASVLRRTSSNMLLVDATFGLLLPGLAVILMPSLFLGGSITPLAISTVVVLIAEMYVLSVHLCFQDSPAYPPMARLLLVPLAMAPLLLAWHAMRLPPTIALCVLPTGLVFARSAWRAWKRL